MSRGTRRRGIVGAMRVADIQTIGDELAIKWDDGRESFVKLEKLRRHCPCAGCKGEMDIMGNLYKNPDKPLTPEAFRLTRLAMVGGYDFGRSRFNRAVQAKRQPGSAFKPFLYAAALENGVTPSSVFVDQPIDIDGWKPENYTEGYQGRIRLTEAVARSINTIAVQVSESKRGLVV